MNSLKYLLYVYECLVANLDLESHINLCLQSLRRIYIRASYQQLLTVDSSKRASAFVIPHVALRLHVEHQESELIQIFDSNNKDGPGLQS